MLGNPPRQIRAAKHLALRVAVFWSVAPLAAQNVGRIAGTVTEANTSDPLPGTNVVIVGSTMGAATDVRGDYYILNVPSGRYSLRASMIG